MSTVVLIPAYKPNNTLLHLVSGLSKTGFDILIVDDGSGKEYQGVFESTKPFAKTISFEENFGKGAALKYGISRLLELFPDCTSFITADSDGQHAISDIISVKERLCSGYDFILTTRTLKKGTPFRSRFGNALSRYIYAIATGQYLPDNQSGLRGFSISNIDWLLKIDGEKYDYEMNVLIYANKQNIEISTLPIQAIYFDDNNSSHFEPVGDTLLIYKSIFKNIRASLISLVLYELLMIAASFFKNPVIKLCSIVVFGLLSTCMCLIYDKYKVFSNIKYHADARIMVNSCIRYIFYLIVCFLLNILSLPVLLNFNIALIACVPLEYFILKIISLRKRPHQDEI